MHKKLLTLAVAGALAVPAVAFAQVTVYGTIDGGLRTQSKADNGAGGTDSNLVVTDGLRTTNRIGFKGSEDLGGGLMANFTMEGQHASDTGQTAINTARKSVVGLSKGGMSIDVGRDYTVNFKTQGIYDPMSYTYTGIAPSVLNTAGVRFSNLVTAGFRFGTGGVRVDYTTGANPTSATPAPAGAAPAAAPQDGTAGNDTGDGFGVNGDFAFGPVTVAAAFSTFDANAAGASVETTNIGAAYKMGAFTFRGGWSNTENEATNQETPMFMLGVQFAFSPTLNGRIGLYNHETETAGVTGQERKQLLVALDYSLSKRTVAYVLFDRLDLNTGTVNLGGAQSGNLSDGATGISVGLAHSF
jgi:predicted porin